MENSVIPLKSLARDKSSGYLHIVPAERSFNQPLGVGRDEVDVVLEGEVLGLLFAGGSDGRGEAFHLLLGKIAVAAFERVFA